MSIVLRQALLLVLVFCWGCASKQSATAPVVQAPPPAPDWVRARPMDPSAYIGIGQCPVLRPDHVDVAKRNALSDLASEISVRVEGNSLLYTLDRRTSHNEEFASTVRTSTDARLEGYELAGSWSDGTTYWTYYRLDRATYARSKAERKQRALEHARTLYNGALSTATTGDLRSALGQNLQALLALREYWGEGDEMEVDGRSVPLATAVFAEMERLAAGLRLTVVPERCRLELSGGFAQELRVKAVQDGRPAVRLPMRVSYPGRDGAVRELRSTDDAGVALVNVARFNAAGAGQGVRVVPEPSPAVADADTAVVRALLAQLNFPVLTVPVDLIMPRVHLQAEETNLGKPVGEAGTALVFREELTKAGFRMVDRAADADLLLRITGTTREGGNSNGMFTCLLDLAYVLQDRRSGDRLAEGGKQAFKGVHLDATRAGTEAYRKLEPELRSTIVPAMLRKIL